MQPDTGVAHQTSDAQDCAGSWPTIARQRELAQSCVMPGTTPEGPRQDPGKGNPGQCYSEWILDSSQGKGDAILKRIHYLRMQPLN